MKSLAASLHALSTQAQGVLVDIRIKRIISTTVQALRVELVSGREEWLIADDVKGIKSLGEWTVLTVKREAVYHQRLHDDIIKS